MGPERSAQLTVAVVMALLPIWFFFKGLGAEKRSLRLANFALACGLCALVPQRQFRPTAEGMNSALIFWAQLGMVLVGVTGLVLAGMALWARRTDGGTGVVRLMIASALSLLMVASSGFVATMSRSVSPENNRPWEWTSAKYDYRLRLPSASCVESRTEGKENIDGAFNCREHRMRAMVSAERASAAEYAAAVEKMRTQARNSSSQEEPVLESTSTEAGWPCTRMALVEPANGEHGPLMVSVALVHWPEHGLLMTVILEAEHWTVSEAGKVMGQEYFTRSARQLQLSLGPAAGGGDS